MYRYLAIGACALFLELLCGLGMFIETDWLTILIRLAIGFFPMYMLVIFMHCFISWAEEKDGI